MADDRSNSAVALDALLANAKAHATNAERHETEETTARRWKIREWAACADEIIAAQRAAKAEGWNLTNGEVGRAMDWKGDRSVQIILQWRQKNPGDPAVITSGPWDDSRSPAARSAAARHSMARRVLRDEPEFVVAEIRKQNDPVLAGRLAEELTEVAEDLNADSLGDVEGASEPNREPVANPVLRLLDVVRMGDHVLFVGNSERAMTKLEVLEHAGLPFRLNEYFPDADGGSGTGDGEMNVVVITDQPYGQEKDGILNDHRANWGSVYRLFQPRGGFVFCAFHPPWFRAAEDGIIEAGGEPKEYLVLNKGGGRMWNHRLQNRLDGVIYFERNGEVPWIEGQTAVAWLSPKRTRAAMEERKRMAGTHTTPKYIDVLERLIDLVTKPGDIVLDPFAGSGTTLIACQRTGRRFIGIELDPQHAERAVLNWLGEPGCTDAIVHREFADGPISFANLQKNPGWGDYDE